MYSTFIAFEVRNSLLVRTTRSPVAFAPVAARVNGSSHKCTVSWRRPSLSMDPPSPAVLQLHRLMEQQLQVLQRMEQQQQTIIRLIRTQSNKRRRSQNGNSPLHDLQRRKVDGEHVVLLLLFCEMCLFAR